MSLIFGIVLGGAFVVFALQNIQPVMVTFLGWSFEGPIALILIAAFLVGVVISLLFSPPSFIQSMIAESKLKGHNEALRRELEDHKSKLVDANQKIAEAKSAPDEVIITKL